MNRFLNDDEGEVVEDVGLDSCGWILSILSCAVFDLCNTKTDGIWVHLTWALKINQIQKVMK